MSVVHNERVPRKSLCDFAELAASALSNVGVAIAITGVVTPAVNALYGTAPFSFTLFKVAPGLLLFGFVFHVLAQLFLGRLKDV